jgi:hypothetical protein
LGINSPRYYHKTLQYFKIQKGELKMENTNKNYILNGVGYTALLAAVVEQARNDAQRGDADALKGIEEWRNVVESDINFKLYE